MVPGLRLLGGRGGLDEHGGGALPLSLGLQGILDPPCLPGLLLGRSASL